jgi:Cupin domain
MVALRSVRWEKSQQPERTLSASQTMVDAPARMVAEPHCQTVARERPWPIVGSDSCQVDHIGYVLEGRMALRMEDGTEREFGPGDAFHMPPGHDAWIIGDEACVLLDFGGLKGHARAS